MNPDSAMWGLSEHLLAKVFDVLQEANWQRQGDNRAPRPEPLPRPGVEGSQPKHRGGVTREEVDAFLKRVNPRPDEQPDGGGPA